MEPQVQKDYYHDNYDSKKRWMSYWYQIQEVLSLEPGKVLEIGPGNKTVTNYLKQSGVEVATTDIAEDLNPDYSCGVTELTECFDKNSFGVILCAEVLEHLPFEKFQTSLKEISEVARKNVVLTLPYSGFKISFTLRIPFLDFNKTLKLILPVSKQHQFAGQHYWEVGKKNYSRRKIREEINAIFKIKKEYFLPENPNHILYLLEKRK